MQRKEANVMLEENTFPGFVLDEEADWKYSFHRTSESIEYQSPHNRTILHQVCGRFGIDHIAASDLVHKGKPKDVDALIDEVVTLRGALPTVAVVTKSGLTFLYMWSRETGELMSEGDLGPFGMRVVQKLMGGEDVKFLPNLGKRLTVLTRSFPVQMEFEHVKYVRADYERDDRGRVIGIILLEEVVPEPDQVVIAVTPKHRCFDGCIVIRRSIMRKGIDALYAEMAPINEDKARRVKTRLLKASVWNVRGIGPDFGDLGGFIKGDGLLTGSKGDLPYGVDMVVSEDNLKAEMFSKTGKLYFLADVQHDSRHIRWTDRQLVAHHPWLLQSCIGDALDAECNDVLDSIAVNKEPRYLRLQKKSVDMELSDDNINVFMRRYTKLMNAGVFNMSTNAINWIAERWLKKLKPKAKRGKSHDSTDAKDFWQDSRKFPVPVSELRTVKSMALAKVAGWVEKDFVMPKGTWKSMEFGIIMEDEDFEFLCDECGGADLDDHWGLITRRAASDASFKLYGRTGRTIHVQAGQLFTVFVRPPLGVSSDAVDANDPTGELGVEYMILIPTKGAEESIIKIFAKGDINNIPEADLNARPKRKSELNWDKFPCPEGCEEHHPFGHPTKFVAEEIPPPAIDKYEFSLFRAQAHTLAKVQAMGGVGARANLELVLLLHKIIFPFRCHTEDWVDLFTKSICHPNDVAKWKTWNAFDAKLVKRASKNGNPICKVALERILLAFPRRWSSDGELLGPGVTTTSGRFDALRIRHLRSLKAFMARRDRMKRTLRKNMIRLLKAKKVWDHPATIVSTRVITENGHRVFPRIIEEMMWETKELERVRRENGDIDPKTGKPIVTALEFEEIGRIVHGRMINGIRAMAVQKGIAPDAQEQFIHDVAKRTVLSCLAWCYRVWKLDPDRWLLNGPFLDLYIEVLQDLQETDKRLKARRAAAAPATAPAKDASPDSDWQ